MKKLVTKRLVRKYLKARKYYRNDDKLLTLMIWKENGFFLTPKQEEIFMRLPSAETISRRRREMRAEFPESDSVRERRYKNFQAYTDKYGTHWTSRWFKRKIA